MRQIASVRPATGACTLASAMEMWEWTLHHLQKATDPDGGLLYHGQRRGCYYVCAGRCSLLATFASRCQIMDVLELEARGGEDAVAAEGLAGTVQFLSDLCHAGGAGQRRGLTHMRRVGVWVQSPLRPGMRRGCSHCFTTRELEDLEETMPGISAFAVDVIGENGSHPAKAGPCAGCAGASGFQRMQNKLTTCLSGARLAKDRAADTLSKVMIPEALDYPA